MLLLALAGFITTVGAQTALPSEDDGNAVPELDCVISPSEVVDLGAAVPGVVESIHAHRNDLVKKGAVVAKLESNVERVTLELAKTRAELNTAVELRQESARFGHLTQQRNRSLRQKSVISQQEMDQVRTETRIAELQVRQERDNQRLAGIEYQRAQAVLARRTIRSPVEGVVMERFKSVGEYVEDEPLLRLARLDPLYVEVIVPVEYLGSIVPGMQAQVTPAAKGAGSYLATVETVDRVADAASGTFGVRLSLSNPELTVPTGLRCRLAFQPRDAQEPAEIVGRANRPGDDGCSPLSRPDQSAPASDPAAPARRVCCADQLTGSDDEAPGPVAAESPAVSDHNLITPVASVVDEVETTAEAKSPRSPAFPADRPDTEAATLVASPELPTACYTIGPIADEALVSQLSERLEDASCSLLVRQETVETGTSHIVLAAPEPDRQATKALIERLDSVGIDDRFLLQRGPYRGRVSLGLYHNKKAALKRKNQLAERGFEAEVVSRHTRTVQYRLDVSTAGTHPSSQIREIASSLPPSASFKPMICRGQLAHR